MIVSVEGIGERGNDLDIILKMTGCSAKLDGWEQLPSSMAIRTVRPPSTEWY